MSTLHENYHRAVMLQVESWDACKKITLVACSLHCLMFVYEFLLCLSFKVRAGG